MAFADLIRQPGREPVSILEMELDYCPHVCGCNGSGVDVLESTTVKQSATTVDLAYPGSQQVVPVADLNALNAAHRTDWQGRRLQYATSRTNYATNGTVPGNGPYSSVGLITTVAPPDGVSNVYSAHYTASPPPDNNAAYYGVNAPSATYVKARLWIYIPSIWTGGSLYLSLDAAPVQTSTKVDLSLLDQWQPIEVYGSGFTVGAYCPVVLRAVDGDPVVGEQFYISTWEFEFGETTDIGSYIPTDTAAASSTDYALSGVTLTLAQSLTADDSVDWDGNYVSRCAANVTHFLRTGFDVTYTGGNCYSLQDMTNVADYVIQAGDYFEFDVRWNGMAYIGPDFEGSGFNLRDSGAVDQNGLPCHPAENISAYALNQWYHRKIPVPASLVGLTVTNWCIVCEQDAGGTVSADFDGINITDGAGTVRFAVLNGRDDMPVFANLGSQSTVFTQATLVVNDPNACYNTYYSCRDQASYTKTSKPYFFPGQRVRPPVGAGMLPCLIGDPTIAPTKILPEEGLGWRGATSVVAQDFPHHDRGIDPYVSARDYVPESQGTFFGKLKARNPYYRGRVMKVWTGFLTDPFDWNNFESRTYVIDKIDGPDREGRVKISGKDILALADDKAAQVPAPSDGVLLSDITAAATSLTLGSGQGAAYAYDLYTGAAISASVPGYLAIGNEVLQYTSVTGDVLGGLSRAGYFGTTAAQHTAGDSVQQCLYFNNVNVVDAINHILRNYTTGIGEDYIPYDAARAIPTGVNDEWDIEKANWLSNNNLTHALIKPMGVNECLVELTVQNLVYLWWDEVAQHIKLRSITPNLANVDPPTLTELEHLVADSISVSDKPDSRISQIWVYYDKIDITGDDTPENYRYLKVSTDSNELANAYNAKAVKTIYANWMTVANAALITTLAGRLLNRYRNVPLSIKFTMDAKDSGIRAGDHAILRTQFIQSITGALLSQKLQVLKVTERVPGHQYEFEAESFTFELVRYAFVAPNGMVDYSSASDAEKKAYGFISSGIGNFPDGGTPYLIA